MIWMLKKKKISEPQLPYGWSGDYQSWEEAAALCDGYSKEEILERCKASLLKVKNGEAVYERDSVLFDEVQYNWPLTAALLKIALENNGNLCVLDFGGSLGSSYFQNRHFLNGCKNLEWCIVEQPGFVDCGRNYFESKELFFYHSLDECLRKHNPEVLLLSGVLQYLPDPDSFISACIQKGINYMLIARTSFIENIGKKLIAVQRVPEEIYKATYPCWFFDEKLFIKDFLNEYVLLSHWRDQTDSAFMRDGKFYYWQGFFLKRK